MNREKLQSASPSDGVDGKAARQDVLPDGPAGVSGPGPNLRHAVRTPLNHIIGYSELLLDEARDRGLHDMQSDLLKINAAGRELLAFTDRLFDIDAIDGEALAVRDDSSGLEAARSMDTVTRKPAMEEGAAGARLLVVDDNESNRSLMSRLLEREGYRVECAADGAEALKRVGTLPPDLVLMDVMMPVMDGIDACRRLKDDPETRLIPVVIMTALGEVEDRVRGLKAGADDFLTKPVDRGELLARIQTSLCLKRTVDDKLDRLKGAQAYLARFVPQSVLRRLEQNPDAPELEKTEQNMSALFVDVSGYTRMSESMHQTADFMVEKYFSRYLDAVHANGGDVTETSGDGLMVVFPGDEPREHAFNAVSAAVEILQKTQDLNTQLAGIFDPVSVHIGINSGIALIGPTKYEGDSGVRWVYTALGPAVNLAARIAAVAESGTICIGPQTAHRVEGRIRTQELGMRQLKNLRDEIMIHRVVAGDDD